MSIFKNTKMDQADCKKIVVRIGIAFRELPDNQTRFEVLATLAKVLLVDKAAGPGPAADWLDTAQASLEGCARYCNVGKGKEKQ